MPPKRKQIDETSEASTSTTRSTRASTRASATTNTSLSSATTKKTTSRTKKAAPAPHTDEQDSSGAESSHVKKRARTSATSTRKTATKGASGRRSKSDDDHAPNGKISSTKELHIAPKPAMAESVPAVPVKPQTASKKAAKSEPYSPQRALELFSKYTESDNPDLIGPEGFEKLCTDANMPLDGPRPIIFAWQIESKEMANIRKDEWVKGTGTLRISSLSQISLAVTELEDLLMHGETPVASTSKKDQEYDRTSYFSFSQNTKAAFQKLYLFAFTLAKPEYEQSMSKNILYVLIIFMLQRQSKNIDMETAVAFWTVLLLPKFPIMLDVIQFISEKRTYKAANKDLWSMMLEFCEVVSPSLENYEADGAWPTLLDDFAVWKKGPAAANGTSENMKQ